MQHHSIYSDYDVIIVGARCAGASTAMLLARRGLSVLVVDRARYGSDTLSTHALMRPAVLQLHHWGVLPAIAAAGTPPIHNTSFRYGDERIDVAIKPRDGVDALYAPRRTVLDAALVDAARRAGARVLYGVTVTDLVRDPAGRVAGVVASHGSGKPVEILAPLVIGADGLRSTIAKLVNAEPYHRGRHRAACMYAYWTGLEPGGNRWDYLPGMGAGFIPTNADLTCAFACVPASRFETSLRHDMDAGFWHVLDAVAPDMAEAARKGERKGPLRGFAGHVGVLRPAWGPGWALVGDAGYFRDPFTAHGITDALRDAELLARAVARGGDDALDDYQAQRDDLARRFMDLSDEVASFDWDLDQVKSLHLAMSKEMAREQDALLSLHTDQRLFRRTSDISSSRVTPSRAAV